MVEVVASGADPKEGGKHGHACIHRRQVCIFLFQSE
jgi:hypothetical protein